MLQKNIPTREHRDYFSIQCSLPRGLEPALGCLSNTITLGKLT